MEIKGTAVKITPQFVKQCFPDKYFEWIDILPEQCKNIVIQPILATNWYDLVNSVIIPTQKVAELFYNKDEIKAAHELGRFSSEIALKGIYKIFLKVSSPGFVISRASSVFSTYYRPSEIEIIENEAQKVVLSLKGFKTNEKLIMYRIGGWMSKTLELTFSKDTQITYNHKEKNDNLSTEITAVWQKK